MIETILALDVGQKRIGVARANTIARIPESLVTLPNNQEFKQVLLTLIKEHSVTTIIVGLPRNMSGEETPQTEYIRTFIKKLKLTVPVHFQDETLTSIHAAEMLESRKGRHTKEDVDSMAAVLILEDYLQENHGGIQKTT